MGQENTNFGPEGEQISTSPSDDPFDSEISLIYQGRRSIISSLPLKSSSFLLVRCDPAVDGVRRYVEQTGNVINVCKRRKLLTRMIDLLIHLQHTDSWF